MGIVIPLTFVIILVQDWKKKNQQMRQQPDSWHLELPNGFTSTFSQDSCNNTGREQMRKPGSKTLSDARNYELQTTDLQKIILSFLSSALCPLFIKHGLRNLKGKELCLPNVWIAHRSPPSTRYIGDQYTLDGVFIYTVETQQEGEKILASHTFMGSKLKKQIK